MADHDFTTNLNTIQFDGPAIKVGAETVNIAWRDSDGNIFLAKGATVPTDATAGYGVGCFFIDSDASTSGNVLWVNEGTAASCDFNSVTVPTAMTMTGDVTGDSDGNTVAKINGTALGTTTATSGNVLTANGTNWSTATPDAAGLVAKAGNQTIAGTKTFSSTIVGSVNGNAATVTNGVYTTDIGEKIRGLIKATYDFAVDGGAVSSIKIGNIPNGAIITNAFYEVETAPTSNGSATIAISVATDGVNGIVTATAYNNAAFTEALHDAIPGGLAANMIKATDDRDLQLTIGTAALTAGKINVYIDYVMA